MLLPSTSPTVCSRFSPRQPKADRPRESSNMDCHRSKLNGTVFGIHDWLTYLWVKRPRVGNLSGRPTILSLKANCLRWRRSARRSLITSKVIWQAGKAVRRVDQGCHERGRQLRGPYSLLNSAIFRCFALISSVNQGWPRPFDVRASSCAPTTRRVAHPAPGHSVAALELLGTPSAAPAGLGAEAPTPRRCRRAAR